MEFSAQNAARFIKLREKYQCTNDEMLELLLTSFELTNGDKRVVQPDAITTTGQKRESASYMNSVY